MEKRNLRFINLGKNASFYSGLLFLGKICVSVIAGEARKTRWN